MEHRSRLTVMIFVPGSFDSEQCCKVLISRKISTGRPATGRVLHESKSIMKIYYLLAIISIYKGILGVFKNLLLSLNSL